MVEENSNKTAFIVCCKHLPERTLVFDCVSAIKKFHPDCDIVVVDSDSEDKSYLDELRKDGVIIEDVKNKNYEYGATVYAFNKYKDSYKNYVFIQDSVFLNKPYDFKPCDERNIVVHNIYPAGWERDLEAREWAVQYAWDQSLGHLPEPREIVNQNMFAISAKLMEEVLNSSSFKNWKAPNCKVGSRAWEKIWQVVFEDNKVNKVHQRDLITKIDVVRD